MTEKGVIVDYRDATLEEIHAFQIDLFQAITDLAKKHQAGIATYGESSGLDFRLGQQGVKLEATISMSRRKVDEQ